jgi:hypothetical protein
MVMDVDPDAVAAAEMVMVVDDVNPVMVAPTGMPVPEMAAPTSAAEKAPDGPVTVVDAFVVVHVPTRLQLSLRSSSGVELGTSLESKVGAVQTFVALAWTRMACISVSPLVSM